MIRLALVAACLALAASCSPHKESEAAAPPSPAGQQTDHEDGAGFFKAEADAKSGKLLVTLPAPDKDGLMLRAIYATGLTAGLGSNPVGLDRGLADDGRIIDFRKIGPKVVIEQENWNYRATTNNPDEKRAVRDSFARSFLWSGDIVSESDAGVVVDISSFLTSDTLDIRGILKQGGQGDYAIDKDRSFPDYKSVLVFPDNVEMDAYVTLTSDKAGSEVAATAANGRVFTLIQHHSFVRLPDDGYKTRAFDPRIADIDVPYYDFGAELSDPIINRFARRFRLEKIDPNAPSSPVKKPIVFYIDNAAPEPIRSALKEGVSWWADAFKAAGFENAFIVKILPEGASPMDVRYNVVEWTHRQTRGWSYGGGVSDPRTGEMIKAHVVLGSQRVRQDRMIFEGLEGADKTGSGAPDDPNELALARIRQLGAHEVGHTLGFAHNFAASTNGRASVMDYPAPDVRVGADGKLDFSHAYAVGVGEWDKVMVKWLYSEFPKGTDEKAALNKIVKDAYASGLRFVDDNEARSVATANPYGAVWDNGDDPIAALKQTMRVREIALRNFGTRSLKAGQPISDLRAILTPIYLYHRYEVDAAAKSIGGYDFRYAEKGDPLAAGAPVPADRQRVALEAIVATLDPAALDLPDATLDLLTPKLASFGPGLERPELFGSDTGAMFDLLSAADAAGTESLTALLHPARAARLIETERRDPGALRYEDVLRAIEARLFAPTPTSREAEIARRLQTRFVSMLIDIAGGGASGGESQAASLFVSASGGATASPAVIVRTDAYLRALRARLSAPAGDRADAAERAMLASMIDAHLAAPAPARAPVAPQASVPPGSPIGSGSKEDCWFCDVLDAGR